MKTRINQGYEIIKAHKVNDCEIVIGYRPDYTISKYACWICFEDDYYTSGQYSRNYSDALKYYNNRIKKYSER